MEQKEKEAPKTRRRHAVEAAANAAAPASKRQARRSTSKVKEEAGSQKSSVK